MWVAGGAGLLFALIAVVSVILIFSGGLDIMNGLIGAVVTGAIAAACFGLVYAGYHTSERGPTEEPPFGN